MMIVLYIFDFRGYTSGDIEDCFVSLPYENIEEVLSLPPEVYFKELQTCNIKILPDDHPIHICTEGKWSTISLGEILKL